MLLENNYVHTPKCLGKFGRYLFCQMVEYSRRWPPGAQRKTKSSQDNADGGISARETVTNDTCAVRDRYARPSMDIAPTTMMPTACNNQDAGTARTTARRVWIGATQPSTAASHAAWTARLPPHRFPNRLGALDEIIRIVITAQTRSNCSKLFAPSTKIHVVE